MEFEAIQQFLNDEDEDSDNYFLQPAPCPYNMTEKIAAANKLLNNNEYNVHERNAKVKFRENLVDYEPDYTSDEGTEGSIYENNIGADETIYDNSTNDLDVQLKNKLNLDITNSDEDEILEEIFDDDPIIVQEPIFTEATKETLEDEALDNNSDTLEIPNKIDEYIVTEINLGNRKKENIDPDSERSKKCNNKYKSGRKTLKLKQTNIICKDQCVEKLSDSSKFRLPDYNQNKKSIGPILKLKKRKCCDLNLKPKLPEYTGFRSEYGLSPEQLEKREKLKVLTRKRGILKKEKQKEIKEDKLQQNEKIFCDWLKEIAKRKELEQNRTRKLATPYCSPKFRTSPITKTEMKERPKTANEIYDTKNVQKSFQRKKLKRPHTSSACVFIEVPKKCLQKGIQIGDLLVTNGNRAVKKLHVLTTA